MRADKLLGAPKLIRQTMEYVNETDRLKSSNSAGNMDKKADIN
jgi:hypothetical protein